VVEFEGDAPLVPVALVESSGAVPRLLTRVAVRVGADARRGCDCRPADIKAPARLDFDDVGAQISKESPGEGAGPGGGEFEDADPFERQV